MRRVNKVGRASKRNALPSEEVSCNTLVAGLHAKYENVRETYETW